MNLSDAYNTYVPKKRKKRLGCGDSSGHGGTSCRGNKGQKARSGVSFRPSFEGGRMPFIRQVPKRGFNNKNFRIQYTILNVDDLNRFSDGTVVDPALLLDNGIIRKIVDGVKILGSGDLSRKLTVRAHAFTKSALEKIAKAGGKTETIANAYCFAQKGKEK